MTSFQRVEKGVHSNSHFWELLAANYYKAIAVSKLINFIVRNFHKLRRTIAKSDKLYSGQQLVDSQKLVSDYYRPNNCENLSETLKSKKQTNHTTKTFFVTIDRGKSVEFIQQRKTLK